MVPSHPENPRRDFTRNARRALVPALLSLFTAAATMASRAPEVRANAIPPQGISRSFDITPPDCLPAAAAAAVADCDPNQEGAQLIPPVGEVSDTFAKSTASDAAEGPAQESPSNPPMIAAEAAPSFYDAPGSKRAFPLSKGSVSAPTLYKGYVSLHNPGSETTVVDMGDIYGICVETEGLRGETITFKLEGIIDGQRVPGIARSFILGSDPTACYSYEIREHKNRRSVGSVFIGATLAGEVVMDTH